MKWFLSWLKYRRLLESLERACFSINSHVELYVTQDGKPAICLEVQAPRLMSPPYLHVAWSPGRWVRGTVYNHETNDVSLERLRYAYEQARIWEIVTGGMITGDLEREGHRELKLFEVFSTGRLKGWPKQ